MATDFTRIYARLSPGLQNLVISAYGIHLHHQRYGKGYERILDSALERMNWSRRQILEFQGERLRALLRHCQARVPYYQAVFQELNLDPRDIQNGEDLQRFPLLTKEEVRRAGPSLLAADRRDRPYVHSHTSGTTGAGLKFIIGLSAHQEQWAVWWRYRMKHGINPGTWCAYFGGRTIVPASKREAPFWRINWPAKQVLYSTYHMNSEALPYYVDDLLSRKLPWIHGYPSVLTLIARHCLDRRIGLRFKWATTGAENLLVWQKHLIEEAFGCRCRQHYGSAEAVANFSECEAGNLHADEDFSVVELVPTIEPGRFSIVGTSLGNYTMPFVRYETGDVCGPRIESCPCGRDGLIVSRIDGRQEDYVLLKDRSPLGRLDHVFKDAVNIREAQIRQEIAGQVVVRVVPGSRWTTEDEQALLHEFRDKVGDLLDVKIELCDRLEGTGEGKLRFVVSDLGEGKLDRIAHEVAGG